MPSPRPLPRYSPGRLLASITIVRPGENPGLGHVRVREDRFYDGQNRPVSTPVGLLMSYGSHPSYQASLDDGNTWADVPGSPWVEENDYRGLERIYFATQSFLLAADPKEGWIGHFGE